MALKIPFNNLDRQYRDLRSEIQEATDTVLRSGKLMSGNNTHEFEHWLARRNRVKYAVTLHSGTQGLELVAEYLRTVVLDREQPTAAVPAMTYVATANAFMRAGFELEIIDTNRYGIMDMDHVNVQNPPDVLVMVGLYGTALEPFADRRTWADRLVLKDICVIEDAAQHWLADNCQRMGMASVISFDPTKNFSNYGNGGAVVTNDFELYNFLLECRSHGKPSGRIAGTNSRMSEVDCAQMLVKTRYIDTWQQRRREIANHWCMQFKNAGIRTLIDVSNFDTHCYHKFVIDVDNRDEVKKLLQDNGIDTRIHYEQPLHEISVFRQWPGPDLMSRASALSRRVLSLPIYPELTDLEVEFIADQVRDCVSKVRS
jgi:dTDP-4-amino-4,6-dideoxygalactose transaminase